ncbi:MAG: hypothetical protein HS116_26970 [Planctomycetes bacterium]|nr:hypothetical protein [Planctomycetota bacterium]
MLLHVGTGLYGGVPQWGDCRQLSLGCSYQPATLVLFRKVSASKNWWTMVGFNPRLYRGIIYAVAIGCCVGTSLLMTNFGLISRNPQGRGNPGGYTGIYKVELLEDYYSYMDLEGPTHRGPRFESLSIRLAKVHSRDRALSEETLVSYLGPPDNHLNVDGERSVAYYYSNGEEMVFLVFFDATTEDPRAFGYTSSAEFKKLLLKSKVEAESVVETEAAQAIVNHPSEPEPRDK